MNASGRQQVEEDEAEAWLRQHTFAEEDRALFTTAAWNGGYRWFRSPNVVCIEQHQHRRPNDRDR